MRSESSRGLTGSLLAKSARGALWLSVASGVVVALSYYRSWLLSRLGEDGELVGDFAVLLLLGQILVTFFSFGGGTTLTTLLPKLPASRERASLLGNFTAMTGAGLIFFSLLAFSWREGLEWALQRPISDTELRILVALAPLFVFAKIVEHALSGLLCFGQAAMASMAQPAVVCGGLTALAVFPGSPLLDYPLVTLGTLVLVANGLVVAVALFGAFRDGALIRFGATMPRGFWPLAWSTQGNKVATFGFVYLDQVLVLHLLGVAELGVYFVVCQLAMLVRYVPTRIGQVMLASFATLSGRGDDIGLENAYRRLCRVLILTGTPLALVLALNARSFAAIFGPAFSERASWLPALVLAMQIGLLEPACAMLALAQERSGRLFGTNVVASLLQLAVMLLLAPVWGVAGVIVGRLAGLVATQSGLFLILRSAIPGRPLKPPYEYFVAVILLSAVVALLLAYGLPGRATALALTASSIVAMGLLLRVRSGEIRQYARLLRQAFSRSGS